MYENYVKKRIKSMDKVLFYNSYELLQESILLEKANVELSEIHLYDDFYAKNYENLTFKNILTEFCCNLKMLGFSETKVFIHHTKKSLESIGDFDFIGAIDYCATPDTLKCYQELCTLANSVLKNGGSMISCQHWSDQVDIRLLKKNILNELVLETIFEYVRPAYYEARLNSLFGERIYKNSENDEYVLASGGKIVYALIKFNF
jgi:hypothetical protein